MARQSDRRTRISPALFACAAFISGCSTSSTPPVLVEEIEVQWLSIGDDPKVIIHFAPNDSHESKNSKGSARTFDDNGYIGIEVFRAPGGRQELAGDPLLSAAVGLLDASTANIRISTAQSVKLRLTTMKGTLKDRASGIVLTPATLASGTYDLEFAASDRSD